MPFYEYQCKNCGHEIEAMQKVSDAPLRKCPHCGKSRLQRLMSAPVFRLKGGGWYETDFKGDGDNKRNLADKPESDAVKDKDSKPTDQKSGVSDTKTEAAPAEGAKAEKDTRQKPEKASRKAGNKKEPKLSKGGKKLAGKPTKKLV
jgi:putative FmdB family regulatory protein